MVERRSFTGLEILTDNVWIVLEAKGLRKKWANLHQTLPLTLNKDSPPIFSPTLPFSRFPLRTSWQLADAMTPGSLIEKQVIFKRVGTKYWMRIDCLIMSVQKESEGERMIEGRSRVFSFFFFRVGVCEMRVRFALCLKVYSVNVWLFRTNRIKIFGIWTIGFCLSAFAFYSSFTFSLSLFLSLGHAGIHAECTKNLWNRLKD